MRARARLLARRHGAHRREPVNGPLCTAQRNKRGRYVRWQSPNSRTRRCVDASSARSLPVHGHSFTPPPAPRNVYRESPVWQAVQTQSRRALGRPVCAAFASIARAVAPHLQRRPMQTRLRCVKACHSWRNKLADHHIQVESTRLQARSAHESLCRSPLPLTPLARGRAGNAAQQRAHGIRCDGLHHEFVHACGAQKGLVRCCSSRAIY
jgi:hypothetical protein